MEKTLFIAVCQMIANFLYSDMPCYHKEDCFKIPVFMINFNGDAGCILQMGVP
jgi:hypothetical protein